MDERSVPDGGRYLIGCVLATCDIVALGEDGPRVFGTLRSHGHHCRGLFDIAPSGRHGWRSGAPIFMFDVDRIRDLWVLGDIHGLIGRLKAAPAG
ncbi:MAG: hypothetical protein JO090_07145 [Rhizobacter sp.]|nr:hypothetical protein [Rhizobacter sp.]